MLILIRSFPSVLLKQVLLFTIAACVALSFSGCGLFKPRIIDGSALERISPEDYPGFADDMGYDGLEHGIIQSITYLKRIPLDRVFRFGDDAYDCGHMIASLERFLKFCKSKPSGKDLKAFIASNYRVYKSVGDDETGEMLFTGYYEPALTGSLKRSAEFQYPVFSMPKDLAFIDLSLFDPSFKDKKPLVGRFANDHKVVPYYERGEIARNNLDGKAVPIAWVNDHVDLFFLQIQGSGKIYLENGVPLNVNYHATNGHPYKSIGALLIREEKISREEMSMQKIREYLKEHPDEVDDILNHNPSYVFFRVAKGGPFGCLGVKVTPGRSVALQKRIFPAAALG
ncbi:MAG: MltA domain-containing protein, partial [Deltaproteobacteria bacterium]|nr:MltA domain-containing protein [Deltaproteobacteria bacterium]